MSAEHPQGNILLPETSRDNFGIEMRYRPEALYAILTRENRSSQIVLDNNWENISEDSYDEITSVDIAIFADLKVKYEKNWCDRKTKVFWVASSVITPGIIYDYDFTKLQELLFNQGLDLDLTSTRLDFFKPYPREAERQSYTYYHKFLVPKGSFGQWGILRASDCKGIIDIWQPLPVQQLSELMSAQDLNRGLSVVTTVLEKVIRAEYEWKKKELPSQRLEFSPDLYDEEKRKAYLATCPYCKSNYYIAESPVCPQCGASTPNLA